MAKYKDFIKEEIKIKKKSVNINDIIEKASVFFGRPITIVNKDEFSIDIYGESGIKKEELLDYISNIVDNRIKSVCIKGDNIHIEL